jgi:hypothetical protein
MSYPVSAPDPSVWLAMAALDHQIASDTKAAGCPRCGGPLHESTWTRKPRGADLPEHCCIRWGLCCGHCRKRTLPDSTLFCGRHVYLKAVLLLVVAARQQQLSPTSLTKLHRLFGVSAHTVRRWVAVFLQRLRAAPSWQRRRGRISPVVRDAEVPHALFVWLLDQGMTRDTALTQAATLVPAL